MPKTPLARFPTRRFESRTALYLAAGALCLSAGIACAGPSDPGPLVPPAAASRVGPIGLIRLPSANLPPEGYFTTSFFGELSPRGKIQPGDQVGYANGVTFLPHLEIGIALDQPEEFEDLTANVKLQVIKEGARWPALAIGTFDQKNNAISHSQYIVASRHFLDGRIDATLGYLGGYLKGPYGGIEAGLVPHLTGILEYDTRTLNYGGRAAFFHNYLQLAMTHLAQGWSWNVGLLLPLSLVTPPPSTVELPRPTAPPTPDSATVLVQKQLVRLGLENVAVREDAGDPHCLEAAYENRSFPHNEINAVANVLAAEAAYAPDEVKCIAAVIKRDNLPVMRVSCPLAQYRDFMAGRIDSKAFARVFTADYVSSAAPVNPQASHTRTAALSYGHADLILRPNVLTEFASENYLFAVALRLQPELDLPIAKGVMATSTATIPLTGPLAARSNLPFISSFIQNPHNTLDQLSVHWTVRPAREFAARLYAGSFPFYRDGGFAELLWLPSNGRLFGRATYGDLKQPSGISDSIYSGEIHYYVPEIDLLLTASAGKYLNGDTGEVVSLVRRFGNTELGMEFRDTSIGRAGLLTLSVPVGPSHIGQRPGLVRIRPPDFFDYSARTLLTHPNFISVADATGNPLPLADDMQRTFLDRDKILPAYFLRSLDQLRSILPLKLESSPGPTPSAGVLGGTVTTSP